jgi:hypothetical protein
VSVYLYCTTVYYLASVQNNWIELGRALMLQGHSEYRITLPRLLKVWILRASGANRLDRVIKGSDPDGVAICTARHRISTESLPQSMERGVGG